MEYKSRFKPNTHFSHAYEAWTGYRWDWEIDGKRNDPMDSEDPQVVAFYIGFNFAKRGQEPIKNIKKDFNNILNEVKRLEKKIKDFTK